MIKLLCGLYEPTEGAVFLDKKNLREWAPEDLLKRVSLVFQDFNKYQLTIKENVGVGEIARVENAVEVEHAMHKGGAHDLLAEMPDGLETTLGTWFPGGRELSGGQWQKVAVSRAFMRKEADILVLDEPTAALDPEAESLAFQKFHELTKGKTSLIISHRFPVARLAEKIVVLEQGEIAEQGSHEELMRLGGRYAHLFTLQAKGYD
jgi:ATP-binding cassette subfamily B protein